MRDLFAGFGKVKEVVLLGGETHPPPTTTTTATPQVRQALMTFSVEDVGGLEGLKTCVDSVIGGMNSEEFGNVPMHLARAPFELVAAHLPALASAGLEPSRVVELREMLVVDGSINFSDPEELEELRLDITSECARSGTVEALLIPPPSSSAKGTAVPVYAAFATVPEATACLNSMKSKLFEGRLVVARYVSMEEWKLIGGANQ